MPYFHGNYGNVTSSLFDHFAASRLATFASDTRLYEIETPLGPDKLLVESWVGREALSSLYEWQIFCLGTDAGIELKTLIAKQVILRTRLADGTQAARSGWVAHIAQLGSDGGLARYRLTVVPWLWLATRRRSSRVFQDKSVLEIVEHVFRADGARANWWIAPEVEGFLARARPRSYCCQYRESDYDFISRLLAEEGIGFYFEEVDEAGNGASRQRLVLFADSTAFADDRSAAGHGIRFHRASGAEQSDSIQAFGSERRLQAATTAIASWDYKAKRVLAAALPTAHRYGGENAPRIESYDWAGVYAFATQAEAEHYARILREAADARFKDWFGHGSVRTFRAGTAFELTGSPLDLIPGVGDDAQRRRFCLLGVLHAGVNNLPAAMKQDIAARLGANAFGSDLREEGGGHLDADVWPELLQKAQSAGYANRFTAIRADIPWRPALVDGTGALLNPKPTAWGSQTAIVVGPDGGTTDVGTVHTDELGRIRIRFHWQREESNTC